MFFMKKKKTYSERSVNLLIRKILSKTVNTNTLLNMIRDLEPIIGNSVVRKLISKINIDEIITDDMEIKKWMDFLENLEKK